MSRDSERVHRIAAISRCIILVVFIALSAFWAARGCVERANYLRWELKTRSRMVLLKGTNIRVFPPNRRLKMYTHNPQWGAYTAQINADGFRDRNYPRKKPPDTIRIIILGDSFTFGWGLKQDDNFDNRLESWLNQNSQGSHFEVINLSLPGINHYTEQKILKTVGIAYDPDVVMVSVTLDDFLPDNNQITTGDLPDLPSEFKRLTSRIRHASEKEHYLKIAKRKNLDTRIKSDLNILWKEFVKKPFKDMTALSKTEGFHLVIFTFVDVSPWFNTQYLKLSRSLDIPTLYCRNGFRGYENYEGQIPLSKIMIPQDGHPTAYAIDNYAYIASQKLSALDLW
ncbi:MAG: hypothetical protein AB1546_08740 [bacterium]